MAGRTLAALAALALGLAGQVAVRAPAPPGLPFEPGRDAQLVGLILAAALAGLAVGRAAPRLAKDGRRLAHGALAVSLVGGCAWVLAQHAGGWALPALLLAVPSAIAARIVVLGAWSARRLDGVLAVPWLVACVLMAVLSAARWAPAL